MQATAPNGDNEQHALAPAGNNITQGQNNLYMNVPHVPETPAVNISAPTVHTYNPPTYEGLFPSSHHSSVAAVPAQRTQTNYLNQQNNAAVSSRSSATQPLYTDAQYQRATDKIDQYLNEIEDNFSNVSSTIPESKSLFSCCLPKNSPTDEAYEHAANQYQAQNLPSNMSNVRDERYLTEANNDPNTGAENMPSSSLSMNYDQNNQIAFRGNNIPPPVMTFQDCQFGHQIESFFRDNDFHIPLPLQSRVWPAFFNGRDVIAVSPPNSGAKTALSVAAVVKASTLQHFSVLIVTTRREAVSKIQKLCDGLNSGNQLIINIARKSYSNTQFYRNQNAKDGFHILITTFEALIGLFNTQQINISQIKLLIFHHTNFILSQKKHQQFSAIFNLIEPPFQTLLFMQSSSEEDENFIVQHIVDPVGIYLQNQNPQIENVKNEAILPNSSFYSKLRNLIGYNPEDIFWELFQDARNRNLPIDVELLQQEKYSEILQSLMHQPNGIKEIANKLLVFNNLLFVDDLLKSVEPISTEVTIAPEDDRTKALRIKFNAGEKQRKIAESTELGDMLNNVMIIKGNFRNDENLEKLLPPLCKLYLMPNTRTAENAYIDAISVTLLLVLRDEEDTLLLVNVSAKKFESLERIMTDKFSLLVLPYSDMYNAVRVSINRVLENDWNILSKVQPHGCNYVRTERSDEYYGPQKFTYKQQDAINTIANGKEPLFGLHGPPGSGKTATLVEAVTKILDENESKKILVTTPSNDAANVFVKALLQRIGDNGDVVFRFMASSRDVYDEDPEISSVTQKVNLWTLNNETREYSNTRTGYATKTLQNMKKFRVIVTTLGLIPKLKEFINEQMHFNLLIVDEVTQINEMFIWQLIHAFGYNYGYSYNRLIIAGDPMQLGPITTLRLFNNKAEFGFKTSLLSRLCGDPKFTNDPDSFVQLDYNHRSHPAIVNIASHLFYDRKMISSNEDSTYALCEVDFLPNPGFPVVFYDIYDGEELFTADKSAYNLKEVEAVAKLVELCKINDITGNHIGVVSPYKEQSDKIRKEINDDTIIVDTVEKYQGGEKPVIIISAARTTSKLGFIEEKERFNTAITRAQHLLLVVGNRAALENCDFWKEFIAYCSHNGSVENHPKNKFTLS